MAKEIEDRRLRTEGTIARYEARIRDHTKLRRLLDIKAMPDESDGRPDTIRKHAQHLAHYHANDANLEAPGFGDVEFGPIFEALKDVNYTGYVSVEVFIFDPGPEAIATKGLKYMKQCV